MFSSSKGISTGNSSGWKIVFVVAHELGSKIGLPGTNSPGHLQEVVGEVQLKGQ